MTLFVAPIAWAADEPPTQAQIDEVYALTKHKDANLRRAAVNWLLAAGAPAIPCFIDALKESQEFQRWGDMRPALCALGAVAVPALTEALQRDSVPLLVGAADVLGEIGPDAAPATAALAKLLTHPDEKVRSSAAYAIKRIGPAASDVISALPDEMRARVADLLKGQEPGREYGLTIEREPIPDLAEATATLEEEKKRAANYQEEATPSQGKLSPGDVEWEVVRKEVPSEQEGARAYYYRLKFKNELPEIALTDGYDPFDEEGAECVTDEANGETFSAAWVSPNELLSVSWEGWPYPGTSHETNETHVLYLLSGDAWKKVYDNTFLSFGRGGPEYYIHGSEESQWDPDARVLKIVSKKTSTHLLDTRAPLSTATEKGSTIYQQNVTDITERLFRIRDEKLEFMGDRRLIDPGEGTFNLADIPLYLYGKTKDPAEVIARIRRLNPSVGASDEFQGALVVDTNVPEKDPPKEE